MRASHSTPRRLFPLGSILLCYSLLISLLGSPVAAQSNTGVVTGVVADKDGAFVVGAVVRLGVDGSLASPATTDGSGRFRIGSVPAGKHSIEVVCLGFANYRSSVDVGPGQETSLSIPLQSEVVLMKAFVVESMVEGMALEYQKRWSRPPSEQELAGLVDAYVRDEILYREGVTLGLDRDDPVIKRRVRQKLEVIAEEQLARDAPTDADLAAYLEKNAERFARPGTVSFE